MGIIILGSVIILIFFIIKGLLSEVNTDENESIKKFFETNRPENNFYQNNKNFSEDFIREKIKKISQVADYNRVYNTDINTFKNMEDWSIRLVLSKSTSISFADCLLLMKQSQRYREYVENGFMRYEAVFKKEDFYQFRQIYQMVKSLKGTRVFIGNELIEKSELTKILRCAVERAQSGKKDFCFGDTEFTINIFGCKRVGVKCLDYGYSGKAWYNYAFLRNGYVFIDKDKILEDIKKNLIGYRFCPFLNLKEVWDNFCRIPARINLDDENFAIVKTDDGGIIVECRWNMWGHYTDFRELKIRYGNNLLSTK